MLSFNRFTVAQANHPVSIRATYGPFSTKQTVPARYIVPEDADNYGYHAQVSAPPARSRDSLAKSFEFRRLTERLATT